MIRRKERQIKKSKGKKKKKVGKKYFYFILLILLVAGGFVGLFTKFTKNGGGLKDLLAAALGHERKYSKKST